MQKIIVLALLLFQLITLADLAQAAKLLRFGWDYDAVEAAHIDGFRLYQNGVAIQTTDGKPPSASLTYLRSGQQVDLH